MKALYRIRLLISLPKKLIDAVILLFILLVIIYIAISSIDRSSWPRTFVYEVEKSQLNTYVDISFEDFTNEMNFFHYNKDIEVIQFIGIKNDNSYKAVCIESVDMSPGGHSGVSTYPSGRQVNGSPLEEDLCMIDLTINDRKEGEEYAYFQGVNISETGTLVHSRYYYPYDSLHFNLSMNLYGYYPDFRDSEYRELDPTRQDFIDSNIYWKLDFPGWELHDVNLDYALNDPSPNLEFTLIRPQTYRLLTPFLLGPILLFICIIYFISDVGALSQTTLAMVFGIWTIKQILIPTDIKEPIFLDAVILMLYGFLSVAVLLTVASLKNREKQREKISNERLLTRLLLGNSFTDNDSGSDA